MHIDVLANKVVCVDSLFDESEYRRIEQEIEALRPKIEPTYHESDVTLYRAALDTLYPDRKQSYILQAVQTRLYSDELTNAVANLHDLSYTLMNKQHKFRTFLTEMRDDTDYRTHTDTGDTHEWTQIFMSWIWYYNPLPDRFTGGQLKVVELDLTIEPNDNRLVLLPAYLRHRITPANYRESGYYRTTINGFLSYAGSGESTGIDLEIERSLAEGTTILGFVLPEPQGHLGRVRQITATALGRLQQAGFDVTRSADLLQQGDKAFRASKFRDAYRHYQRAYRAALS